MTRSRFAPSLLVPALLVALPLLGCKKKETTEPPSLDLSGTYELVSVTFEGQPTLGPPVATGTLVLTRTTYQVNLNLPGQDPITETGTYSIEGNNWSQTSDTGIQSVGTFSLQGDILTVNVTTLGMQQELVWRKTS